MSVTVRIKGRLVVVNSPAAFRAKVRAELGPTLRMAGARVANDWRRAIPHKWPGQKGTPTFRTSTDIVCREVGQLTVSISTGTVSGLSLETGAVAHEIWARQPWSAAQARAAKKYKRPEYVMGILIWPEERGGRTMPSDPPGWRIRHGVAFHPGVEARGYGMQALLLEAKTLPAQLQAALARIR